MCACGGRPGGGSQLPRPGGDPTSLREEFEFPQGPCFITGLAIDCRGVGPPAPRWLSRQWALPMSAVRAPRGESQPGLWCLVSGARPRRHTGAAC